MLLIIVFLTGFVSLVFEIIWAKVFALFFGSTVDANTLVIAAFMLGLGLGALYWGRRADSSRNPVRLLSFCLLGIGCGSAILLLLFTILKSIYQWSVRSFGQNTNILIFLLAFIFMFIPAFLTGGILPLVTRIYIRKSDKIGDEFGRLYALNTLGSIIGAGVSGYFLIRALGLNGTQMFSILIILLCVVFLFLKNGRTPDRVLKEEIATKDERSLCMELIKSKYKFIPIIAGLTGFIALGYEVVWLRALSVFLANATYTFTTILIIYLGGIFVGSYFFSKKFSNKNLIKIFIIIQVSLCFYVSITTFFLNTLPVILFPVRDIMESNFLRIFLPPLLLALILVFPPALLMGISFPLLCTLYTKINTIGKEIGMIYFTNTLGSMLGSIFAGFFILPLIGIVRGIVIIVLINLAVAICAILISKEKKFYPLGYVVPLIIICLSIVNSKRTLILPPSIYRTPTRADRVLYYKETKDGTVIVSEDRFTNIKACYVNNSAVIGTTYDAIKVVKMLGHLPFLFNPGAEDVLVIGFGVGVTTAAILEHNVRKVDCVEICPGVRKAAEYFTNFNNYVFNNQKVKFISADGRNFLFLTEKKYDVISCDPTHPGLGSGNLYTREYFLLCKEHLNENGVISQYLPLHRLSLNEFKSLIKTFVEIFPHTTVWLGHSHGILIGTNKATKIDFQRLKSIPDELLKDPYLLSVSLILDGESSQRFSKEGRVNTDDRPILEFFTPASLGRENWETNIKALLAHRTEPEKIIENIDDPIILKEYLDGQKYYINGLIYQNRGERKNMIEEFRKALKVNPHNEEIELFIKKEL
ncbi:MAG: fused MFS/spermidine synthase [candidate division WOR-3 bacterium]